MRGTYVMRRGRLVRKREAPRAGTVNLISDNLSGQLEHMDYADGRRTDSKSTYRRWTREAGSVEKGNDRERPKLAPKPDIRADVAEAVQMCKNGYRPRVTGVGSEGWHD